MKYNKNIFTILVLFLALNINGFAQAPPPPNGGTNPNDEGSGNTAIGETPPGGGAPISGGLGILLVLGAAYGARQFYNFKKEQI